MSKLDSGSESGWAKPALSAPEGLSPEQQVEALRQQVAQLERSVSELSLLYEISQIVETDDAPEESFARALKVIRKIVPYEACTLFLFSPDGDKLHPAFSVGYSVNLLDGINFTLGKGLSAWVAQERKPVLLSRMRNFQVAGGRDNNGAPLSGTSPFCSFASVPLILNGNVLGVLNLSHSLPDQFDEETGRVLTIAASQIAATVKRTLAYQRLQQQAVTDGLTGLYNHRYFQRRFTEEVKRARRYHSPLTLLLIDADNFRQVNERCGHQGGDAALKKIAQALTQALRETDVVARYGGEEFAVLLPQTEVEPSLISAERLRSRVNDLTVPTLLPGGREVTLSVSIGVAGFPRHAPSREELFKRADEALYRAKREGKNRVCCAGV